jgi:hypothetical protein
MPGVAGPAHAGNRAEPELSCYGSGQSTTHGKAGGLPILIIPSAFGAIDIEIKTKHNKITGK